MPLTGNHDEIEFQRSDGVAEVTDEGYLIVFDNLLIK